MILASFLKVISPLVQKCLLGECCRQLKPEQFTILEENMADEISGTLRERFTFCALKAVNLHFRP